MAKVSRNTGLEEFQMVGDLSGGASEVLRRFRERQVAAQLEVPAECGCPWCEELRKATREAQFQECDY